MRFRCLFACTYNVRIYVYPYVHLIDSSKNVEWKSTQAVWVCVCVCARWVCTCVVSARAHQKAHKLKTNGAEEGNTATKERWNSSSSTNNAVQSNKQYWQKKAKALNKFYSHGSIYCFLIHIFACFLMHLLFFIIYFTAWWTNETDGIGNKKRNDEP